MKGSIHKQLLKFKSTFCILIGNSMHTINIAELKVESLESKKFDLRLRNFLKTNCQI